MNRPATYSPRLKIMSGQSFGYEMEEVVENYLKYRPTYTSELYEKILMYLDQHAKEPGSMRSLAIDVGCGSGNSTVPLAKYFTKVIGIDSSLPQITVANRFKAEHPNVLFEHCSAYDMSSFVADNSVDLVTSGESLHWFNIEKFSQECLRILKPGGMLAAYLYPIPVFENPKTKEHIEKVTSLVEHYTETEGRHVLDNYQAICPQLSEFFSQCVRDDTIRMRFSYSIGDFQGLFKTTPQYYRYKADHPDHPDDYDDVFEKLKDVYGTDSFDEKVDYCVYSIVLVVGRKPK